MSRLNLSEDKENFNTAINAEEIFKHFKKHLEFFKEKKKRTTRTIKVDGKEKVMRRAKRRKEKKVFPFKGALESLPKTLFSKTIHRLIKGILLSEFTFNMIGDGGSVKMHERFDSINALSKHKEIDAIKARFKYYDLIFTLNPSARSIYGTKGFITFSKEFKDLYIKEIENGSTFQSKNTINVYDLSKIIQAEYYPDLDIKLIRSIIQHGFKIITASIHSRVNVCLFEQSENKKERVMEFVYFCNNTSKIKTTKKMKYVRKLRFLEKQYDLDYSGYYYACLTHEQCNTFNKKSVDVKLYRIMEEAMINPEVFPHIIAVKIYKPLFKRYEINTTIKYEKANTKYIWRWSDQRFESVDNSELVINRRFKRYFDNI